MVSDQASRSRSFRPSSRAHLPHHCVGQQPSARRRSSLLAFKGPAQPKRERKKTVLIDPIVPRRASLEGKGVQKGVKRRRTSGASDGDKVDMKKADRKKRNKGKKRAREEPHDDEDEGDSSGALKPSCAIEDAI